MRKGVVDTAIFDDYPKEFLLGQVAVLGGCASWLLIATVIHMPVSTTHSLVGATLGFSLVVKGLNGIRWSKIAQIGSHAYKFGRTLYLVASWFISPLLSGTISAILYMIVDFAVLRRVRREKILSYYITGPFLPLWSSRLASILFYLHCF